MKIIAALLMSASVSVSTLVMTVSQASADPIYTPEEIAIGTTLEKLMEIRGTDFYLPINQTGDNCSTRVFIEYMGGIPYDSSIPDEDRKSAPALIAGILIGGSQFLFEMTVQQYIGGSADLTNDKFTADYLEKDGKKKSIEIVKNKSISITSNGVKQICNIQ